MKKAIQPSGIVATLVIPATVQALFTQCLKLVLPSFLLVTSGHQFSLRTDTISRLDVARLLDLLRRMCLLHQVEVKKMTVSFAGAV